MTPFKTGQKCLPMVSHSRGSLPSRFILRMRYASLAELVDAPALGAGGRKAVRVRPPGFAQGWATNRLKKWLANSIAQLIADNGDLNHGVKLSRRKHFPKGLRRSVRIRLRRKASHQPLPHLLAESTSAQSRRREMANSASQSAWCKRVARLIDATNLNTWIE